MAIIKKTNTFEKGTINLKQKIRDVVPLIEPKEKITRRPIEEENLRASVEIKEMQEHILEDARFEAEKIISDAHDESSKIVEEANIRADEIRQKSVQEGIEKGLKEGQDQVSETMHSALETLNDAVKERKKIIKDSENELVRLALKIAEHVIRKEVTIDKEIVMNIIMEALGKMSERENIIIRVSKEDGEYVKKSKDKISGIMDGVKSISIIEDSFMEPGGCVIETNLGYVDAKISTKISLIEQAIKKVEKPIESK